MNRRTFLKLGLGVGGVLMLNGPARAAKMWWQDDDATDPVLAAYTGIVATRCSFPSAFSTAVRQSMSRSPHYARADITSLQIIVPNWRTSNISPFAEVGSGATASVTASIEYPIGVMTQVLFSGVPTGTVPDVSYLISDAVSVTIPKDALFCVRMFWESTTGCFSTFEPLTSAGGIGNSGYESAMSGITDKTMSGSVTSSSTTFAPCGIIATTTRPSFVFLGDSIAHGEGDTTNDTASGDYGYLARSLGPSYGYLKLTRSGDQAFRCQGSPTNRQALCAYASHMICAYGSNDIYSTALTVANIKGYLQTIWGWRTVPGGKTYQTTITTRATSVNGYVAPDDQVVTSGGVKRLPLNDWIRTLPAGLDGYFEVADLVESARDSEKWKLFSTANYITDDGTHPNDNGHIWLRDSGVIAGAT